ncbi:MAG: hypothetical protein ACUVUE_03585 [Candidatus Bathycorpusculaceae bacterium]
MVIAPVGRLFKLFYRKDLALAVKRRIGGISLITAAAVYVFMERLLKTFELSTRFYRFLDNYWRVDIES